MLYSRQIREASKFHPKTDGTICLVFRKLLQRVYHWALSEYVFSKLPIRDRSNFFRKNNDAYN